MFFPLGSCGTTPLVKFADFTLRNITITDGLLPPGIINCDKTMPCRGFNFENVNASGWWSWVRLGYYTRNVEGTVVNSIPVPKMKWDNGVGAEEEIFVGEMERYVIEWVSEVVRVYVWGDQMYFNEFDRMVSVIQNLRSVFQAI